MPSQVKDAIARCRTRLSNRPVLVERVLTLLFAGIAVVVGVVAAWKHPTIQTQNDALAWFGPLLGVLVTLVIGYSALARRKENQIRTSAVVIGGFGCLAALIALLKIPVNDYKYLFGIVVGALIYNVLAFASLLFA